MTTETKSDYFYSGSIVAVVSLLVAMGSYLIGMQSFYYLSFALIIISLLLMLKSLYDDLVEDFKSTIYATLAIFFFIVLYLSQRLEPFEASFLIGDASDYYWAGVSSALNGDDIGIFLPLTSAISAIGFKLFGYRYIALIEVTIHLMVLLSFYHLLKRYLLAPAIAFAIIILVQMIPLDIWLSKTTFSEPIWQLLMLILIYYSIELTEKKQLNYSDVIPLYLLLLLLPMSRGSSVFIFVMLGFLSIYSLYSHNNLKSALLIALGMIALSISLHYSLEIKEKYLIGMQYRRILPHITANTLAMIFYLSSTVFISSLFLLRKVRIKWLNFYIVMVALSIVFKISASLFFAHKKGVAYTKLLYLNEFGLLRSDLGMPLALLAIMGMVYLYIKALRGDRFSLIVVIFYSIFTVPFVMQNVSAIDQHEMLLYWHRYYFSEYLLIHLIAISAMVGLGYNILSKLTYSRITSSLLTVVPFTVLFLYSINLHLHNIVTSEGYLQGSSRFFPWLSSRVYGEQKVAIIYGSDVHYGILNAQQLMYRGIYVTGVKVGDYQKISPKEIKDNIKISEKLLKNDYLLILATNSCTIEMDKLIFIDRLSMPLSWRRSTDDIYHSSPVNSTINACLYKIRHHFEIDREVRFNKNSDIAPALITDGWYQFGKSAIWSQPKAKITLPNILSNKKRYLLEMKFGVYNAIKESPKDLIISINGKEILHKSITQQYADFYSIDIPPEIIADGEKKITIDIEIPNAVSPYEIGYSKDKRVLGISLYSLKLSEKNKATK
ncbi:hypothetical protein MNB_SV-6-538 [hydrothermal vent metagenome]|uniref:Uncharacterized protein n=1 Tax=hydrothermal vent metagenome TaxID=652676 RepID=A0A1W1CB87_9ZZZZ